MTFEEKKKIVIDNYFKNECSVDTSIREAYEKGFELGYRKAPQRKKGRWIVEQGDRETGYDGCIMCSECSAEGFQEWEYCPYCGAKMEEDK